MSASGDFIRTARAEAQRLLDLTDDIDECDNFVDEFVAASERLANASLIHDAVVWGQPVTRRAIINLSSRPIEAK